MFTTDRRTELQTLLESLCDHVYFQPPANAQMDYPAIVYRRNPADTRHANNNPYNVTWQYEITLIARDPDSEIRAALAGLSTSRHDRFFVADNLNHDVFTLHF